MNKQCVVAIRFTDNEIAKLKDMAEKRGVSEAQLLRELVRNATAEPKKVIVWSISSHIDLKEKTTQSA